MRETGYVTNHWILSDLDIAKLPDRWEDAVEFADSFFDTGSFSWYMLARKRYLELGGGYIDEQSR